MQNIKLGSYKSTHGTCTCLYWEGTKLVHILTLEIPLSVRHVGLSELRFIQPLTRNEHPYPLPRALRIYRKACKKGGSTSARKLLKCAASEIRAAAAGPGG